MSDDRATGLDRLELRIERLDLTFRFTFAFHAREVRFECDRGQGFERVFPEVFSFHRERHDPSELLLQLDDLLTKPQLLSARAHRRDSTELVTRLLAGVPRYLEHTCAKLEAQGKLDGSMRSRMYQDLGLLALLLLRFQETRELDERRPVRVAGYLLTKLMYRSTMILLETRVSPEYVARYARGEVDPVDATDDPTESGVFLVLETGEPEVVNRIVVRMAERAFYLWLEAVCLNLDNQAFEKEDSPFDGREGEILAAICLGRRAQIDRSADLVPFLRRGGRDCLRVLRKLEAYFLRRYDIIHSSALIAHRARLQRGEEAPERSLTIHYPRNYLLLLASLLSPFLVSIFFYERSPQVFDVLCSLEVLLINAVAIWFLAYKFCWKRDLVAFHAAVPRIGAGIIVGFLPVFLIDEVWGLADHDLLTLTAIATFLGLVTLLFIYVEVQGKLASSAVAFVRARNIFLLGMVESSVLGVVMTSLVGRFMVSRNWSADGPLPIEQLRGTVDPLVGQLPRIVGVEPFYSFPSAVVMMTFLSFFIGIFLQLMWEELPITEPL